MKEIVHRAYALDDMMRVSADGPACRIAFADEGPGIAANVREKVFVPFVTPSGA